MSVFREIRVIPVVLVSVFSLAVLKGANLIVNGGYVFDYQPDSPKRSWAQEAFNFPGAAKSESGDITGSVPAKPKESEEAAKPAAVPPSQVAKPDGVVVYPEQSQPVSASERAVLERLQARRQELEARAREIDIRESLLKETEKRVQARLEELKATEGRIATATEQKTAADVARLKGLVTMYETMKPKDAAKVFDRLEMPVLFDIASQIAPRKMAEILGVMSAEQAEKLTVEMARRGADKSSSSDLPKIEGKVLPQASN